MALSVLLEALASTAPCDLARVQSLWFHQVKQTDGTCAVNYWYDMVFGDRYVTHKLLEELVAAAATQG